MLHAAIALLLASTPAPVDRFGVNAHIPTTQALDAAQDAGLGWVRYDFNWFQMEPSKGSYDWSFADAAVDGAAARGLQVYATLAYTPQWASASACTPGSGNEATECSTQPFANDADWTDFVTAVVHRYKDRVSVYGMWNEPNLGSFWQGTEDQYVQHVLVPGSAAVHAECPTCLVGGPETSGLTASSTWNGSNGICAFGGCIRNGWELDLGAVLDDAGSSIDVVTQHFYNSSAQDEAVGQLTDGEFFGTTMTHDSLRDVLLTHGAAGKPIWLTETGETSEGSETTQASTLVAILDARDQLAAGVYAPAQNDPFVVDKVFLYDLQDGAGDTWGLLRADGSRKPAFDAVADYIATHPSGATTSPTPTPSATPTATSTPNGTPTVTPTPTGTPGNGGNGNGTAPAGGCGIAAPRATRNDAAGPVAACFALLALAVTTAASRRSRT